MTPSEAFKLRAGDKVRGAHHPQHTGTVRGRHGHLIYIVWDDAPPEHLLTYDAEDIERDHEANR